MLIALGGEEVERHLVLALTRHLRWCRENAVAPPSELSAFLATLMDRSGLERPELADGSLSAEPVAVSYEIAARMLGCSSRTIRRMVADGRLKAVNVGRARRVVVRTLLPEGVRR